MEENQAIEPPVPSLPEIVSREDLYAFVWSEPMSRLARRFGLSDVGLAKACARMMVPVPGRGYWAKKDVGRAPRPTRLPTLPGAASSQAREIHVRRREPAKAADAAREGVAAIAVVVPEILTDPHPLIATSIKAFRGGKVGYDQRLTPKVPGCLAIDVTMGSIDRAMRIFEGTIRAIEVRGHAVEIQKYKRGEGYPESFRTVVLIDDEVVQIELTEVIKKVERVRDGPSDFSPKHDTVPSGRLALGIRNDFGGSRSRWTDDPKRTLDSQLGHFIHGIAVAALDIKEQRRKRQEYQQQQLDNQRREYEESQRRRAEAGRVRALESDIDRMHSARWAREYLDRLNASLEANPEASTDEMRGWLCWVEQYVERVDPFFPHATVPKDPKPWG